MFALIFVPSENDNDKSPNLHELEVGMINYTKLISETMSNLIYWKKVTRRIGWLSFAITVYCVAMIKDSSQDDLLRLMHLAFSMTEEEVRNLPDDIQLGREFVRRLFFTIIWTLILGIILMIFGYTESNDTKK
jgi:hypothetical protein